MNHFLDLRNRSELLIAAWCKTVRANAFAIHSTGWVLLNAKSSVTNEVDRAFVQCSIV